MSGDIWAGTEVAFRAEASRFHEQQLVRLDGAVLVSFMVPPGQRIHWKPGPHGEQVRGACAGRVRVLPDGEWQILAYFPEGWPGPAAPWPGEQLTPPPG